MTITRLANETDAAYIARLTAALSTKPAGRVSFKVSEKGALSVYGFQRFPITYYKETWKKLAETMPDILAFAEANDHLLKGKDDAATAPAATTPGEALQWAAQRREESSAPSTTTTPGEALPPAPALTLQ